MDSVATLSPFTHETRRLSCDHDDAIDATRHRDRRDHVKSKFIFCSESLTGVLHIFNDQ